MSLKLITKQLWSLFVFAIAMISTAVACAQTARDDKPQSLRSTYSVMASNSHVY